MGYEDELACIGLKWLTAYCTLTNTFHPTSAVFKYKIETGDGWIDRYRYR
jgi:hypothetical protein